MAAVPVTGVDGKPSNPRFRNMFEEEVIVTEKQKMRQEMVNNKDKIKEKLKAMTPTDIFILFDEDDSGLISFEEFRKMLPYLEIHISDAKAFRYFRMCDTDGSGEIDIDEFQVALFACDPTSGNPVGFHPNKQLTPMDAFEMFDEDQSGFLEEDEFRYAMEYLGIEVTDELLENQFYKYDYTYTGTIDYIEFRNIFVEVCDVRQQLEDRGIDCPTLIRKSTMRKILTEVLMEEEHKERLALAEAKRYKKWVLAIRDAKKMIQKAEFRAYQELRNALDGAGHVYVLGQGAYSQFDHEVLNKIDTKKFKFEHFDKIVDLWRDRVRPQQLVDRLKVARRAQEQDEKRDAEHTSTGLGALAKTMADNKVIIDPYIEAQESPFNSVQVAMNTASLWGKRVYQVAISENVIFALADTGEIYTWGGNSYWWHEIQPDSIYQTKWRGDTTARSQLLMSTKDKELPPDASLAQNLDALSPEDRKTEQIKVVAKYFNCWEPPPNPATRMIYLDKDILPKIQYDACKFSLHCRGKKIEEMTKMQLVEALYADITLEKKLLGERAHKAIREIESQISGLLKRKKTKLAEKFLKRIDEMWAPLREVQAENRASEIAKEQALEHERQVKAVTNYQDWRSRVAQKREEMIPKHTPRGNSVDIHLHGATPRGPRIETPRGYQGALQISAGSAHVCLIHKTGQLYSWGVGAAGRLGLDITEQGDPQNDTAKPTLIQTLGEKPVLRVACGFSHTGAIVSGGDLYMWGSTVTGKCGFGDIVNTEECFCSIPTKVFVGAEDRKIKKLSCGAAHTAVVTEAGQVYVFGCGDGGRLGLGKDDYHTRYEPTLVTALTHERIASVSCGNTTTLACSEMEHAWDGQLEEQVRQLVGGRVYIAGSRNVLGQQYDTFTLLSEMVDIPIKQVSAGYLHSALLSADGAVFCWGHNRSGCCGAPVSQKFVESPIPVSFVFTNPTNLALGQKAYQSTTYNQREASYAVDGRNEGNGLSKCSCTQQESQPWIEIDLGRMCIIDRVVVWNRTDVPADRNQPRDLYTSRLYPCWVMVGRKEFDRGANTIALKDNLRVAVCKAKLTENKRQNTWRCPVNTQGRYVRIQLERYNTLSIAQFEVYGYFGFTQGVGRVSFVQAGRDVTVMVVRPSNDPRDIESLYKRAAYADSLNADILRQLETYTLEYDKYGRGDVLAGNCDICRGKEKCEACIFYETFKTAIDSMEPSVGGRRKMLSEIGEFLISSNKPPLDPIIVPKSKRPTKWELRKKALRERFGFLKMFQTNRRNYVTPQEALEADPAALMKQLQYVNKIDDGKLAEKQKQLTSNEEELGVQPTSGHGTARTGTVSGSEGDLDALRHPHRRKKNRKKRGGGEGGDNNSGILSSRSSNALHNHAQDLDEDQIESLLVTEEEASSQPTTANLDTFGSLQGDSLGTSKLGSHHLPYRHGYGAEQNQPMVVGDILPTGHKVKSPYPRSVAEGLQAAFEREEERKQKMEEKVAEEKKNMLKNTVKEFLKR